jgi:hypothetical protein
MDRESAKEHNIKMAKFLCEKHGCSEKLTKIHRDQIVYRAWNPHPSGEFISWWNTQPEFLEVGIDAVRARNCKVYVERYKEAIEVGLASLPIDYP